MKAEILEFFKKADPVLYPWIEKYQKELIITSYPSEQYFYRICRSIAFQQLTGKAATTIWNRYEQLFPDNLLTPKKVLSISVERMRDCGLSNSKATYIHNIAQAFSGDANYDNLATLLNEEVIELLTKIKGVGRWTAEMFLLFTLGREDIFSTGDWGLIKGMMKIYGMKKQPSKKRIDQITKKWKPYSSYASLTLWQSLDDTSFRQQSA